MAELDGLLVRRATEMTHAARELRSAQVWGFRVTFAEHTLPLLCERLERARALSMAGRTAEAGRKYQALLVAWQVLQLAVAMHAMAQYADASLQPSGQVGRVLEGFAGQMEPILAAALSEEPGRIERALNARPEVFGAWAKYLEQWPLKLEAAKEKAKVAKLVWDVAFLAVAAYQAAGAAAELAAAGRASMPPLPMYAAGGGAASAGLSGAGALELAEALRKLIALGALDAGVVVALSKTFGGLTAASMSGVPESAVVEATRKLSPEQERAIRSLRKQIQKHQEKLERFRESPTPRPGTEALSAEIRQKSIDGRIQHLEREIRKFQNEIQKIEQGVAP